MDGRTHDLANMEGPLPVFCSVANLFSDKGTNPLFFKVNINIYICNEEDDKCIRKLY